MKKIVNFILIITLFSTISIGLINPVKAYDPAVMMQGNAEWYAIRGNYPKAVETYQKFMTRWPNYVTYESYYKLGEYLEKNKQYDEALKNYFIALEKDKEPYKTIENTEKTYDSRGVIFQAIDRVAQIQENKNATFKAYNIMASQTPKDFQVFLGLSSYYLGNAQFEEALQTSKKLLDLAPDSVEPFNQLAVSYYLLGDEEKSYQSIEKALLLDPNNKRAKMYKGFILFDRQNYEAAANVFKNLIPELNDPVYKYRSLIRLSLCYMFLNNFDKALECAKEAYLMKVNRNSGLTFEKSGDFPVVKEVTAGSSADKAGIKAGDFIESIDGASTKGKTVEEVRKMLSGKQETPMTLEVRINSIPQKPEKTNVDALNIYNLRKKYNKKLQTITFNKMDYFSPVSTDSVGLMSLLEKQNNDKAEEQYNANAAYSLYNAMIKANKPAKDFDSNRIAYNAFLAQYPEALVYIEDGKYQEALDILNKNISTPDIPGDFITLAKIQKAYVLYKLTKTDEALQILNDLAIDGFNSKNLYVKKQYEDTLKKFQPLKQELNDLTREQLAKNELKNYVETLTKLLALSESKEESALLRQKLISTAKNMQLSPEQSGEIHKYTLRAEILLKDKDLKGSLDEYRKALKIAPFESGLYYNTALVLGELQKYPEAIDYMNTYINSEPAAQDLQQSKDEIIKWELKLEKEKK